MRNLALLTVLIAAAVGGEALAANGGDRSSTEQVKAAPATGPLDGMEFVGSLGPVGKPKDTPDRFVFQDGMFVSVECERRCDYPARPYFVRELKGRTEFVSETKCPYKDAKIVWRGVVEGDRISGVATWSVNRWYWSWDSDFAFEGRLEATSAAATAAGRE